jgi:hypothetical protein
MRDEESHTLPATLPKVRSSLKQSRAFVVLHVMPTNMAHGAFW